MADKKKDVEVKDLPETELSENDMEKVSGGCIGMAVDPDSIARLNIRQLPGDTLKINTTIGSTERTG